MTNFDARIRAAEAIVTAIERGPDAATLTVANVVWLRESLYRLTLEQLQGMGSPSTLADATDALGRVRDASPQLGSSAVELVYYPITPCRYIDTRFQGGPLAGTRTYDLAFTGGAFGGSIGCDPKAAVGGNEDNIGALAMNVAIVGPTAAPGFVGVRPAGGSATTALVNWWEQGPNVQASNAGVVSTNQSAVTTAEIEFFGSPTQFIVDIFGVFAAPTATALDCVDGTLAITTLNTTTRNYDLHRRRLSRRLCQRVGELQHFRRGFRRRQAAPLAGRHQQPECRRHVRGPLFGDRHGDGHRDRALLPHTGSVAHFSARGS